MGDTIRERRHRTDEADVVACYDVQGFSHPDLLDAAVEAMVAYVAGQPELAEGMQFGFGWSVLTVLGCEEGWLLGEPDFAADDPTQAVVGHVTVTAQVAAMQTRMNERTEMSPTPSLFFETLTLLDGALEASEILLVHGDRMHGSHSGWLLTPRDRAISDRLRREGNGFVEACIYALLGCRPHLLKAMGLPEGSIVSFCDDEVVSVRDKDNEDRLSLAWPDGEPTWLVEEEAAEEAADEAAEGEGDAAEGEGDAAGVEGDAAGAVDEAAEVDATAELATRTGWLARLFKG